MREQYSAELLVEIEHDINRRRFGIFLQEFSDLILRGRQSFQSSGDSFGEEVIVKGLVEDLTLGNAPCLANATFDVDGKPGQNQVAHVVLFALRNVDAIRGAMGCFVKNFLVYDSGIEIAAMSIRRLDTFE